MLLVCAAITQYSYFKWVCYQYVAIMGMGCHAGGVDCDVFNVLIYN